MDLDIWYERSSDAFLAMYTEVVKCMPRDVVRPYISTMTYTAIVGPLEDDSSVALLKKLRKRGVADAYFTTVKESSFCGNVIEMVSSESNVKVKIFNKGSVQLTGCTSTIGCLSVLTEVCRLLSELSSRSVHIQSIETRLINLNACVLDGRTSRLHLERFASALRSPPHNIFVERPERPAACIAHTSHGKAMMYSTGRCSIHAKSPQDIAWVYTYIMGVVRSCCADIAVAAPYRDVKTTWYDMITIGMRGLMHNHPPTTADMVGWCPYCRHYGNTDITAPKI